MLQNDPVKNLQYDSDLRIAQPRTIEPTLYTESTVITSVRRPSYGLSRMSMPISTVQVVDNRNTNQAFILRAGIDILNEMPSVHIEQTFELNEALTSISSENRYIVRSPLGGAIFSGSESSTHKNRMFLGASRPFQMHLLDINHQEALSLRKKFSIGALCCNPRMLEIWAPPGDLLGRVVEGISPFSCEFTIEREDGEILYQIVGPNVVGCCMPKEAHFKIFASDFRTMKGSITRIWSTDVSLYSLNVYFADPDLNVHSKALFLGAAFLLEYMYFQS